MSDTADETVDAGVINAEDVTVGPIEDPLLVEGDRRRGFNLDGKYVLEGSSFGFKEEEFQLIHDLGFNYARLPLDYSWRSTQRYLRSFCLPAM